MAFWVRFGFADSTQQIFTTSGLRSFVEKKSITIGFTLWPFGSGLGFRTQTNKFLQLQVRIR